MEAVMSEKSNLTKYDKKFITALLFMHFGFTMCCISFYGLYYYNRITRWESYVKDTNHKLEILKKHAEKYNSDLKLRGMEWDYGLKGVGASEAKELRGFDSRINKNKQ